MKILAAAVIALFPALASAQTASGTLDMVQTLSVSAASQSGIAAAREEAARPFGSQFNQPVNAGHNDNHSGWNNPGHNDNHGGWNNPGHNDNHGGWDNHGGHPGPVPPPVVHPVHPVQPPVVHPYDPYYPGYHNGGYPGHIGGPTHQQTGPVITGHMSAGAVIGVVVGVAALVLLLALL